MAGETVGTGWDVFTPAPDCFCGPSDFAEEVALAPDFPGLGNQRTDLEVYLSVVQMIDDIVDNALRKW